MEKGSKFRDEVICLRSQRQADMESGFQSIHIPIHPFIQNMFNDTFCVASTIQDKENAAVNKTKYLSLQNLYTSEVEIVNKQVSM